MKVEIEIDVVEYPVGFGNNNNVHFQIKFGKKKKCLITAKFVAFHDNDMAHITGISLSSRGLNLGLKKKTVGVYNAIKSCIEKNDFVLGDSFERFTKIEGIRSSKSIIDEFGYNF